MVDGELLHQIHLVVIHPPVVPAHEQPVRYPGIVQGDALQKPVIQHARGTAVVPHAAAQHQYAVHLVQLRRLLRGHNPFFDRPLHVEVDSHHQAAARHRKIYGPFHGFSQPFQKFHPPQTPFLRSPGPLPPSNRPQASPAAHCIHSEKAAALTHDCKKARPLSVFIVPRMFSGYAGITLQRWPRSHTERPSAESSQLRSFWRAWK